MAVDRSSAAVSGAAPSAVGSVGGTGRNVNGSRRVPSAPVVHGIVDSVPPGTVVAVPAVVEVAAAGTVPAGARVAGVMAAVPAPAVLVGGGRRGELADRGGPVGPAAEDADAERGGGAGHDHGDEEPGPGAGGRSGGGAHDAHSTVNVTARSPVCGSIASELMTAPGARVRSSARKATVPW